MAVAYRGGSARWIGRTPGNPDLCLRFKAEFFNQRARHCATGLEGCAPAGAGPPASCLRAFAAVTSRRTERSCFSSGSFAGS